MTDLLLFLWIQIQIESVKPNFENYFKYFFFVYFVKSNKDTSLLRDFNTWTIDPCRM